MIEIDVDMPAHRAKVLFQNQSKPCFVLHPDKLASDAKTFREIAGMIRGVSPRGTLLANWLETMGEEYSGI